ncbi:FAD-dependent oxidoreductase [Gallaecimonas kandeliae]|uniref:NAD(P)/FAD-dependent oxidoreductase n=1 Tax=Gallaecimonas kandeliae TaxID=3029055 RepID=UPI0026475875|nr:FAD-dependent oxidoreductase [Gallaecimonas kandeliae]WKE64982.1 FAD-dependent oxidoreductase [Gallaecimonas kandeliae]
MSHIAIIGAGLCGITAARILQGQGLTPTIFEKSKGTGGRMSSRRSQWGSFDLGAQYFTARQPRFIDELGNWIAQGIASEWQVTPYQLSGASMLHTQDVVQRYVGRPHMSAITRYLAGNLDVHFETTICGCHRREDQWWLEDVQGQAHGPFDGLLVTTPAPQAVPLISASPRLAMLARKVRMEPCWAVGLVFSQPLDTPVKAALVESESIQWLALDSDKPGRLPNPQRWVIHATSDWSARNIERPPEEVISELKEHFFELLELPDQQPDESLAHRWRFARCSQDGVLGFDEPLKLGAGGDWSHGSRVEGAWLAGQELAERMLRALHKGDI